MDWHLSWKRVGLTFLLFIIGLILSAFLGFYPFGYFFPLMSLLFSSVIGMLLTVLLLGLLSYIFAGRILSHTKKPFVFFLLTLLILQIAVFLFLLGYNSTIGRMCTSDKQCSYICGEGAQGQLFIRVPQIGIYVDCFRPLDAVCDHSRCQYFNERDPPSMSYCNRTNIESLQMACFKRAAEKFNTTECEGEPYCIAQLTENPENCRELTDEKAKSECLLRLAQETNNTALCNELADNERSYCFYRIAINRNESFLCEQTEGEHRRYCFRSLAYSLGDASLCRRIDPASGTIPDIRLDCLAKVAEKTGNLALCDEIPEEQQYITWQNTTKQGLEWRECLEGAATTLHNRTPCYRIIDQYDRDSCLWHVAVFNNDTSFCQEIQYDVLHKECEEQE